MKDFADCLQQRIEAPPAAEPSVIDAVLPATPEARPPRRPPPGSDSPTTTKPIGGFSLFFRALLDRLRRLFRRG